MDSLTKETVFGELLVPIASALERVRESSGPWRVPNMFDFVALGVLRHVLVIKTLRQQVQELFRLEPKTAAPVPFARSTCSDALAPAGRRGARRATLPKLVGEAQTGLPDRLAGVPELAERPVPMGGRCCRLDVGAGRMRGCEDDFTVDAVSGGGREEDRRRGVAKESGRSRSAVQARLRAHRAAGRSEVIEPERPREDWSREERLKALIEAAALSDERLRRWCRQRGAAYPPSGVDGQVA